MDEAELGARMIRLGLMPGVKTIAAQLHEAPARITFRMGPDATEAQGCAALAAAWAIEEELIADAAKLSSEVPGSKFKEPQTH